VRRALVRAVRLWQRTLSWVAPTRCRFHPSCSEYAIEALERHGTLRGSLLAAWRLLRCQPFARAGYDPVPPTRRPAPGAEDQ